jgi:plastocyanin
MKSIFTANLALCAFSSSVVAKEEAGNAQAKISSTTVKVITSEELKKHENVVTQKDKKFDKTTMTVKVGEAVVFLNDDEVVHNVFSATKGQAFNLKAQPIKQASEVTFNTPGTVDVFCAIHPNMKMKVVVKE